MFKQPDEFGSLDNCSSLAVAFDFVTIPISLSFDFAANLKAEYLPNLNKAVEKHILTAVYCFKP